MATPRAKKAPARPGTRASSTKRAAAKRSTAKSAAAKSATAKSATAKSAAAKKRASHAKPRAKSRASVRAAPRVIESTALMQAVSMALRGQGKTIGFVPTMGALHDGHLALIREARQRADVVVVSIFVNPLQFGPNEDLSRYPRTFEADRLLCHAAGVDLIFMPDVRSMYPAGFQTTVKAGALAERLEGKERPGHFDGVLTVVSKLFHLVQPHFAVFGEKDYQQLLLVRRMVRDLHMPVEIVAMPVIREVDGLALSSRNAYLSPAMRARATCLFQALTAAQDLAASGERRARSLVAAAKRVLKSTPELEPQYVVVVDPETLEPLDELSGPARVLVAGHLGKRPRVRLIDNAPLFLG